MSDVAYGVRRVGDAFSSTYRFLSQPNSQPKMFRFYWHLDWGALADSTRRFSHTGPNNRARKNLQLEQLGAQDEECDIMLGHGMCRLLAMCLVAMIAHSSRFRPPAWLPSVQHKNRKCRCQAYPKQNNSGRPSRSVGRSGSSRHVRNVMQKLHLHVRTPHTRRSSLRREMMVRSS